MVVQASDSVAASLGSGQDANQPVPQPTPTPMPQGPDTAAPVDSGFDPAAAPAATDALIDLDALPADQRSFLDRHYESKFQADKAELQRIHNQRLETTRQAASQAAMQAEQLQAWQASAIKFFEQYSQAHGDPRDVAVFLQQAQSETIQQSQSAQQAKATANAVAQQQLAGAREFLMSKSRDEQGRQLFDPSQPDPQLDGLLQQYVTAAHADHRQGQRNPQLNAAAAAAYQTYREAVERKREAGYRALLSAPQQPVSTQVQQAEARQETRGIQTLARGGSPGGPQTFTQLIAQVKAEPDFQGRDHNAAFSEAMKRFERQT